MEIGVERGRQSGCVRNVGMDGCKSVDLEV